MLSEKLIKQYIPMTETAAYILMSLTTPLHGYGIIENVMVMTDNRIKLGAGTIYGTLVKLEASNLINLIKEEDNRKIYKINNKGIKLLEIEAKRSQQLYLNINKSINKAKVNKGDS